VGVCGAALVPHAADAERAPRRRACEEREGWANAAENGNGPGKDGAKRREKITGKGIPIRLLRSDRKAGADTEGCGAQKKGKATYIAPLRPHTLARFLAWGILRELVV